MRGSDSLERFRAVLKQLVPQGLRRLLVAYSGGLDSRVLLALITQMRQAEPAEFWEVRVIHVHHGLHPEADAWAERAQTLCRDLGLPYQVLYAHPHDFADQSPEAAARAARFESWSKAIDPQQDALLLAHHLDDQAETLLLRLCRGTGIKGLACMQALETQAYPYALIRPFLALGWDRADLLAYAQAQGLTWVNDSSNQDLRFDRNYLRQDILPRLKQRWPKVLQAFDRTTQLAAVAAREIQDQAILDLSTLGYVSEKLRHPGAPPRFLEKESAYLCQSLDGQGLSVKALLALAVHRRREALRSWFVQQGSYAPSQAQLCRIEQEVLRAYAGGKPSLKLGSFLLRRWRDLLFLSSLSKDL